MAEVVDWRRCQPSEVIGRAVDLLGAGEIVVFPTETGYEAAASALSPPAVERLDCGGNSLGLSVRGARELLKCAPRLCRAGVRLARNCWPGPLTVVANINGEGGGLPASVYERVCLQGAAHFRAPAHEALQLVLSEVAGPLVSAEVGQEATTESLERWGDAIKLVVDAGPIDSAEKATVLHLDDEHWRIVREGAISGAELEVLSRCRILFVCTGNTCRSPLAQVLCAKMLSDRLGCTVSELPGRGFIVQSAGLAAMIGLEAAPEAVAAAGELGADLGGHCSRPLTLELIRRADFLFVMTRSHLQALSIFDEDLLTLPRLLSSTGQDIADPLGSTGDTYRQCARAIMQHLEELLPELERSK